MAKTVDSSVGAEVGWLFDEVETVSLIAMLVVALSAEMVLLSTIKHRLVFLKRRIYINCNTASCSLFRTKYGIRAPKTT